QMRHRRFPRVARSRSSELTTRKSRSLRSPRTPGSLGGPSTRRHSTSSRNPSGRSASCSRWWFARPGPAGTSSSWANGGGVPLSAGHARALLGLDNPAAQERLAARIVAEGLSVRNVEEIVSLGGDDAPRKRSGPAGKQPVAPGLRRLADRLSDLFETRVKVEMG